MVYLNFTDWPQAAAAQHHFLDTTAVGTGYGVDFWVVCDTAKCYLFSSDDNGHLSLLPWRLGLLTQTNSTC